MIAILDSARIQRDMVPEVNSVQLTNRVPIAHLAIERGIESLDCQIGHKAWHSIYRHTFAIMPLWLNPMHR